MGPTGGELTEPAGTQPGQMAADLLEAPRVLADAGARKRAAVEMIARHERALRNTARRFSLCADDADDAYQRTLEIVLMKAPTDHPRELIRWTHTVMKHEALAVRRNRERLLGTAAPPSGEDEDVDWVTLIPAQEDGPDLRVERRERIARSREALQALKPAELRALTLLAEGYSYAEISEITGFTRTKVNRCLAEGRESFRLLVSRTEDGSRCEEMRALLSAFCDGEAAEKDAALVQEHLRACAPCRATMRSYRATAPAIAAIGPLLPLSHSLAGRFHDMVSRVHSHLPGSGGHAAAPLASSGGSTAGLAGVAKIAAVCLCAAGGAVAGMTTGVIPNPLADSGSLAGRPGVERVTLSTDHKHANQAPRRSEHRKAHRSRRRTKTVRKPRPAPANPPVQEAAPLEEAPVETAEAPVEYSAPPAAPAPPPSSEPSSAAGDGGAGEFGP